MLTIKSMRWNNCFSYGDDNVIHFDKEPLTQLVGINGAGKTSISLMIQEILYGKNVKNIKKQDIANNKSGKKGYTIVLDFDKDGDSYEVNLDRRSSLKFRLYKNGEDISSHTSLNTLKTIGSIIGVTDFKIFCQLIYQHSTDSLDFLTATDMNRKKFLISLLQLDRYLEMHEHFKTKVRDITSEITSLQGSTSTIEAWILRHKDMDFMKQNLLPAVEAPKAEVVIAGELRQQIANINSINKKIIANKRYKDELASLDSKYYLGAAPVLKGPSSQELRTQVRILENQYREHQKKIDKIGEIEKVCHACAQPIDTSKQEDLLDKECKLRNKVKAAIGIIWEGIPDVEVEEIEAKKYIKAKEDFERLNQLIDHSLADKTLDLAELTNKLRITEQKIRTKEEEIKNVEQTNREISAHNSKIDVVKAQLEEMKADLLTKNIELVEKENLADILELLKKTFGTNGLVSYKIESSVKELETRINQYLADLTHFQIYFKLDGEKLNIEVLDDVGNITSISNLSSGERARVNIATILAIRSILSSLTSTKINLLFLDEVIGVIDAEGKEKLSEILLKEKLNTFIVSHDWEHPLIPKINIIKEKHISRIEYD